MWFAASILALAGTTALFVWTRSQAQVPLPLKPSPNVLLISIDTLRADHLGLYGARHATPSIDALGDAAVVFEHAVSHVPITLPSHASLFTATYPVAHGVRDNGSFRLAPGKETLTDVFREGGYRTAAFVGSFALDSRFGLDRGFELYDDFYGDTSALDDFTVSERPAEDVLGRALDWLSSRGSEKWFAFVHLYDPHAPYLPPEPFREDFREDLYTGEVAHVDAALGRFFDTLSSQGRLANTLVVLTSDHGEGLGEHGERTHGMFAYESSLHVPLILSWRGVLPSRRVSSRVRLIDVAPTILALSGLRALDAPQGRSLIPLIEGREDDAGRESYFEALAFNLNRGWAPLTGIYYRGFKYIDLPIAELYDLESDPGETRNLGSSSPSLVAEMASRLEELVTTASSAEGAEPRPLSVDEETRRRLESLGYVTARTPRLLFGRKSSYTADDDPKRLVHLSDKLDEAVAAHLAGRTDEAIEILRAILRERPSMGKAYDNLSYVLRESGRLDEAIAVLESSLAHSSPTPTMRARLGLYLQEAGKLQESAELLESVAAEDPSYAETYNYLGVTYARAGKADKAIETFEKLLAIDPSYASAYSNLASVYLVQGRHGDAERELRRALEIDPHLAVVWNALGVIAAGAGRSDEAVSSWRRSLELDPRQYDTLYNLGTLLTKLNRFEEAVSYLERFVQTAPAERYRSDIGKVRRLVDELKKRL